MSRALGWLLGEADVELTGALPAAFLNECARMGAAVEGAVPVNEYTLRFTALRPELERLRAAAERCGCTFTVLRRRGTPEKLRRVKHRLYLCCGMLAVLLLLFVSSLFIWEISVTENPTDVPESSILLALERTGVGIGTFWPTLSSDMVRSRALSLLPELSYLTVNVHGSRAEVLVRGANPIPELRDESTPTDVVATRAGVVAELRVLEGESAVSVGQTVLPRETLVNGVRTGTLTPTRLVHARAEVTARTWYEKTAAIPLLARERESVLLKKTRWALVLGKRRMNFAIDSGICHGSCDKITCNYPLALPEVFTLPLTLLREEVRDVETRECSRDLETAAAALEQELTEWLETELGERGRAVTQNFTRARQGELLCVTLRAECLERIDRETPRGSE